MSRYKRRGKFHWFRGQRNRPKKCPDTLKQSIALVVSSNLRLSVRPAAVVSAISLSRESIRTIRYELGYHFYDSIPIPPLSQDAKRRCIDFHLAQHARTDFHLCPIIFTDEVRSPKIYVSVVVGERKERIYRWARI
jgi:hypothetical protein